jgi:hypothetical protein
MEEFVEQFSEELTPYSVDLAANLVLPLPVTIADSSLGRVCACCRRTKRS